MGQLLFLMYTFEFFIYWRISVYCYSNYSTLIAVMPSPCVRDAVVESLTAASARLVSGVTNEE